MKYILPLLMLTIVGASLEAQEQGIPLPSIKMEIKPSPKLEIDEFDPFEKTAKKVTRRYLYDGLYLRVVRVGDEYAIFADPVSDLGCCGASGNYISFLFGDDNVYKIQDSASIDCTDNATGIFIFQPSSFVGKKIKMVRLRFSETYKDYLFDGEYTMEELVNAVK